MIIEILWVRILHHIKYFGISCDAVYEFDSIEWLTLNCEQKSNSIFSRESKNINISLEKKVMKWLYYKVTEK